MLPTVRLIIAYSVCETTTKSYVAAVAVYTSPMPQPGGVTRKLTSAVPRYFRGVLDIVSLCIDVQSRDRLGLDFLSPFWNVGKGLCCVIGNDRHGIVYV
jgi:hypothetical protein